VLLCINKEKTKEITTMKIKNKILFPVLLTISLGLGTGANTAVKAENDGKNFNKFSASGGYVQNVNENAQIDWTKNVITVTGAGAPPDRGNSAQKRLMAIRAAKVDAFRQLLEVINGVHVSSETVVRDFVTESDVIKTEIEGLVKGAEMVGEPKYLTDGSVEVEMQIRLFNTSGDTVSKNPAPGSDSGTESIASVLIPEEIKRRQNDNVPDTKLKPENVSENYTSLILDCKGLGVLPAMSPAIFDADDGEVYVGKIPIDPDFVINEGIVSYATTITEAKKLDRAGNNPLMLKATNVKGNFKSDVYVSNRDARTIIGAEDRSKFLKDFRVIMVI
jgi:hypothetical protein